MTHLDPHHVRHVARGLLPSKQIVFIRHGQSIANAESEIADEDHANPKYFDARMTELGQNQASSWAGVAPTWDIEEVYVSPLTRALETACRIFEHCDCDMHVTPYAREGWVHCFENRGRLLPELENGTASAEIVARYPVLGKQQWPALADLPGAHKLRGLKQLAVPLPQRWDAAEEEGRAKDEEGLFARWKEGIDDLKHQLLQSSASRIAVVCHWGIIWELTGVDCENCSLVPTVVQGSTGDEWSCTVCEPIMEHPPLGARRASRAARPPQRSTQARPRRLRLRRHCRARCAAPLPRVHRSRPPPGRAVTRARRCCRHSRL